MIRSFHRCQSIKKILLYLLILQNLLTEKNGAPFNRRWIGAPPVARNILICNNQDHHASRLVMTRWGDVKLSDSLTLRFPFLLLVKKMSPIEIFLIYCLRMFCANLEIKKGA